LKRAAELFAEHAEVEVVYGNAFYIDDTGAITGLYATKDIHDYPLNLYCFICQPTVFMRRSVPERIGLFNDRIRNSFDYEYWLRAHHAGMKFLYTRDVLASCRLHSQTKTSMNRQDIYIECIAILRHFNEEVHPNWLLGFTMELSPPGTLLGGLNKRMTKMATKFFDRYQRNFVGSHERNIREMEKRMFG
jgi:GT2 family glycosyltransferase